MNTSQILDVINNAAQRWAGIRTEGALPLQELAQELKDRFDKIYVGDFYRTTFIVEGQGEFPYDMLRYTASFPEDEQSSFAMSNPPVWGSKWRVKLSKYHRDPTPDLAADRWLSKFHWTVVEAVETVPL